MLSQISVYLPDRPGVLASFIEILMKNKIFITAMTVAQAQNYGLILLLVDKPMKCVELLEEENYIFSTTDVIAVKLEESELYDVPKTLGDNGINIEYLYSSFLHEIPAIVMKVDDNQAAREILQENGFTLLQG